MPAIIRGGNGDNSAKSDRQLLIKQMPGLMSYTEGDPLDLAGLEVQFKDKDQSPVLLAAEKYTTTPANGEKVNRANNTITITHTTTDGETIFASFSVAVKYPVGITVTTLKDKYDIGEVINIPNSSVNLNYNDGSHILIDNANLRFNPENGSAVTRDITEFTAEYLHASSGRVYKYTKPLFVRRVSELKATTLPKTSYIEGELIDTKNLKTTLVYNDGLSMEMLDSEITVFPANGSAVTRDITKLTVTHTKPNGEQYSTDIPLKVKYIVGIAVSHRPSKLTYKVGEKLSLAGAKISVVYNDTSTEFIEDYVTTPVAGEVLSQDNSNIVFSYFKNGQTYTVSQAINIKVVESLSITNIPKLSYYEGERLDLTDLAVQANFNDGSSMSLPSAEYKVFPANNTILNRTNESLRITYLTGGKEVVNSTRLVVTYPTSLTMVVPPKSAYKVNDLLDLTAMRLNLNYSDCTFKRVNKFTTDPRGGATLTAADRTLTITYMDGEKPITLIHPLSIENTEGGGTTPESDITGIKITTPPKIAYREGELLDLDGMVVKAIKKDGTSEIIDGYIANPVNGTKLSRSNETVTLRYIAGNTPHITVQPISVKYHTGIALAKKPKLEYTEGDALTLADMVLNLVFDDESGEEVSNYSCEPAGGTALTKENNKIKITYIVDGQTYTIDQAITVKEKSTGPSPQASPVVSIKITTSPSTTTYREGSYFSNSGMVVKAIREDGSSEVIDGFITSPRNGDTLDRTNSKVEVSATIGGKLFKDSYPLQMIYPIKIAVHVAPKLNYLAGEALNLNGMVVKLIYSDDSEEVVKDYVTVPASGTALETTNNRINITYTYSGRSYVCEQLIVVKANGATPPPTPQARPIGIKVIKMPNKMYYDDGEELDKTGMEVALLFDNDTMLLTRDFTLTKGSGSDTNFQVIVKYDTDEYHFSQTVNFYKKTVVGLYIENLPNKVVFNVNEAFSYIGLKVHKKYSDGSIDSNNYAEDPNFDIKVYGSNNNALDSVGMKKVIISPFALADIDKCATYSIYVAAVNAGGQRTPTGIKVLTHPIKSQYIANEIFDPKGLTVGLEYDNGSIDTLPASDYTIENTTMRKYETTHTINIKYAKNGNNFETDLDVSICNENGFVINRFPSKLVYAVGEIFSINDVVAYYRYTNGYINENVNIINELIWETDPVGVIDDDGKIKPEASGHVTIRIYQHFNSIAPYVKEFQIYALNGSGGGATPPGEKRPVGIMVSSYPNKIDYFENEQYNSDGLVVSLINNDGTLEPTTEYTIEQANKDLKPADNVINIKYNNNDKFRTSHKINVFSLLGIAILRMPKKIRYAPGETFDPEGLIIKAKYSGERYGETVGFNISNTGPLTKQTTRVEVWGRVGNGFEKYTAHVPVVVCENNSSTPVNIIVIKPPTKHTYLQGENFNPEGIEVHLLNEDNSTTPIRNTNEILYEHNENLTKDSKVHIIYFYDGNKYEIEYPVEVIYPTALFVHTRPNKIKYEVDETYDATGMVVKLLYSNGLIKDVELTDCTITPNGALKVENTKLTITHTATSLSAETSIFVEDKRTPGNPVSLEVISTPKKTTYFEQETFDWSGLRVALVHDNGVKREVFGWELYPSNGDQAYGGNGTLSITYKVSESKTFNTTIPIEVHVPTGLRILKMPDKVVYKEGEFFDPAGLIVAVAYNRLDNPYIVINDYWFDKDITREPLRIEDDHIGISCRNQYIRTGEGTIPITVTDSGGVRYGRPISLKVDKVPNNTVYRWGDIIDTTGLEVSVVYEDGQSRKINGYTLSPANGTRLNDRRDSIHIGYRINDHYSDLTADVNITYLTPWKLILKKMPRTKYKTGEKFDPDGMILGVLYSDQKTFEEVYDYTMEPHITTRFNTSNTTIALVYGAPGYNQEIKAFVDITVTDDYVPPTPPTVVAKNCTGIALSGTYPTKFYKDDIFSKSGLVVKALFDDSTESEVGSYTISPEVGTKLTTDTAVTVSYRYGENTQTANYNISVGEPTTLSIESAPFKTEYFLGDKLDNAGIKAILNYSNGLTKDVTRECTFEPVNGTVLNDKTTNLKITYKTDYTVIQPLTISDPIPKISPITGIKIVTPPTKIKYREGELFDTAGMIVKLIRENGESEVTDAYNVAPTNGSAVSARDTVITVTCSLPGKESILDTTSLNITTPTGIAVNSSPKLEYVEGEALNLDGLKVQLNYNDDSFILVNNFTVNPVSGTAVTKELTKITITYGEYTIEQLIVVRDRRPATGAGMLSMPSSTPSRSPVGIKIVTPPKTAYKVNEYLDLSGMVVKLLYDDNTSTEITGYTTVPEVRKLTEADTSLTVNYNSYSASINITVATPIGISVLTPPVDTDYEVGDALNLLGLQVVVNYSDGSRTPATMYITTPDNGAILALENKVITITYGRFTTTQVINIREKGAITTPTVQSNITGIRVTTQPTNINYKVGDILNLSGMIVKVLRQDGSSEITDNYTTEPVNGSVLNKTNTKVTIKLNGTEYTTEQTIKVKAHTGISINSSPNTTKYVVGDPIILDGLKVQLNYDDESFDIVNNYTVDPPNGTKATPATNKITISYTPQGSEQSYTAEQMLVITGEEESGRKTMTGIKTVSYPRKVTLGDRLNLDDMVVRALYSDGSSAEITTYTTEPARNTIIGDDLSTLSISYTKNKTTYTDTKNIDVIKPKKLFLLVPPKHDYQEDDLLDLTGVQVYLQYTDGTTAPISDYTTTPINGTKLNKTNTSVSFTYRLEGKEYTTTQVINVREKPVTIIKPKPNCTGIKIIRKPKNIYAEGEQLDLSEMRVLAYYDDDTSAEVTNYTVSPEIGVPLTKDNNLIRLTYIDSEKEFHAVTPMVVRGYDKMVITKAPKLKYEVGDTLDTTELSVQFLFNDRTIYEVPKDHIITEPAHGIVLTAENTTLKVTAIGDNGIEKSTTLRLDITAPIAKPVVKEIRIIKHPDSKYIVGDKFDSTGIEVVSLYSNGNVEVVKVFNTTPAHGTAMTKEMTNIVVSARLDDKDFQAGYPIKVREVKNLSFTRPGKTSYKQGETLEVANMVVQMNLDDNTSKVINYGDLTIEPAHGTVLSEIGTKKFVVSYTYNETVGTKTLEQEIVVADPGSYIAPRAIELVWINKPKQYYIDNELFDKTNVKLGMKMSDGTIVPVDNYTITTGYVQTSGVIPWSGNTCTLNFAYSNSNVSGGSTFSIQHLIYKEAPVSIQVTKYPNITWNEYDRMNYKDMEVVALYDHREPKKLYPSEYTTSIIENAILRSTMKNITVTHKSSGTNVTFNITVVPAGGKEITAIRVKNRCKDEYIYDYEYIDTTGLEVEAQYVDGTIAPITNYVTYPAHGEKVTSSMKNLEIVSEYGPNNLGPRTRMYLKIKNFYAVKIIKLPTKTVYPTAPGQTEYYLDLSGLVVRYTYSDLSTEDVSFDEHPEKIYTSINHNEKVSFSSNKATIVVYNSPAKSGNSDYIYLRSISATYKGSYVGTKMISKPTKLKYRLGERFSLDGFKLGAIYDGGITDEINNYTTSIEEGTPIDKNNSIVTVTYPIPSGGTETMKLYLILNEPRSLEVSLDCPMSELELGKPVSEMRYKPNKFYVRYYDGTVEPYGGSFEIINPKQDFVPNAYDLHYMTIRAIVDGKELICMHPIYVYDKDNENNSNISESSVDYYFRSFNAVKNEIIYNANEYNTNLSPIMTDAFGNKRVIVAYVTFKNHSGSSNMVIVPFERFTFDKDINTTKLDFVASKDSEGLATGFSSYINITAKFKEYGRKNLKDQTFTFRLYPIANRSLSLKLRQYGYKEPIYVRDVSMRLMDSSSLWRVALDSEIKMVNRVTKEVIPDGTIITENMQISYVWTDKHYYGENKPREFTYDTNLTPRTVVELYNTDIPTKWAFAEGEPISYDGIFINAKYSDGSTSIMDQSLIEFNPPAGSITYKNMRCEFIYRYDHNDNRKFVRGVSSPTIYYIKEITLKNSRTSRKIYYENEKFDFGDTYALVAYDGGRGAENWHISKLDSVFDFSKLLKPSDASNNKIEFTYSRADGQKIGVSQGSYSTEYIMVNKVYAAIGLRVSGPGLVRDVGADMNLNDITVKVLFEDGHTKDLTEECIFTDLGTGNNGKVIAGENKFKVSSRYFDKVLETEATIYGGFEYTKETFGSTSSQNAVRMIKAASLGAFNLNDFWKVGDERKVELLDGTKATMVILDMNGTTSGGTSYQAVIGFKETLYPLKEDSNSISYYELCDTYGYKSFKYRSKIDDAIGLIKDQTIFAAAKMAVHDYYNPGYKVGDNILTVEEKFSIAGIGEVTGSRQSTSQQKQFTYYRTTSSNRIKYPINSSISGRYHLTRDNYTSSSDSFDIGYFYVDSSGNTSYDTSFSNSTGISPIFVV